MTPRLAVIDDRYINYDGHPVISVLADPDATLETIAAMRAALVAAVRDQARIPELETENRTLVTAVESMNRKLRAADAALSDIAGCDIHYANWDQLQRQAREVLDLLSPAPQGEGT